MSIWMSKSHIEIVDGPSHVELVYDVDNDGGSRKEGEQEEKEEVDHHIAQEPRETLHWQIVPVGNIEETEAIVQFDTERQLKVEKTTVFATKSKCFYM